ncbi:MAG: hypothetical protein OEV64_06235 [Desulfobulbaceae bacterium]|nr:hypothetical protein [Desulfobulbaceae bacterium]
MPELSALKECWEIMQCERHGNGEKVGELGECAASVEGMGHTCWAVERTICGGIVQGVMDEKKPTCSKCDVYKMYHRGVGKQAALVKKLYPDEEERYQQLLMRKIAKLLG